jgi:hypothetical protein
MSDRDLDLDFDVDSPTVFRSAVETTRVERGMSLRGVAALSDVGHASYWAWLKSDGADVTLKNALAYAKAVGLKIVFRRA